MVDGRINVNQSTFTNNGLIESVRTSPSVFSTAIAINNGFFKYDAGVNNFATGTGTNTDEGINLNDATETTIEANGLCTVDVAQTGYTYYNDGNVVETSDATGSLTIPMNGVISDPAVLTLLEYPNKVVLTITDICAESVLPIVLSDFQVKADKGQAVIQWVIESEINSDYITIEKSRTNNDWEPIAKIDAQGNSNVAHRYSYMDDSYMDGNVYYRLKMVDLDGSFEYSEVRKVRIDRLDTKISVYPTLVSNDRALNVDLTKIENENITIGAYNLAGVYSDLGVHSSEKVVSLDISDLLPGMNVIKVTGAGFSETYKIIVTK